MNEKLLRRFNGMLLYSTLIGDDPLFDTDQNIRESFHDQRSAKRACFISLLAR